MKKINKITVHIQLSKIWLQIWARVKPTLVFSKENFFLRAKVALHSSIFVFLFVGSPQLQFQNDYKYHKLSLYRSTVRQWCNGYHGGFPSRWPGFDSRLSHSIFFFSSYSSSSFLVSSNLVAVVFFIASKSTLLPTRRTPCNSGQRVYSTDMAWPKVTVL